MATLNPQNPDKDFILKYDRETLAQNGRNQLSLQKRLSSLQVTKDISKVFNQATDKITVSNMAMIVKELEEFTLLLFDYHLAQTKKKDDLIGVAFLGETAEKTPSEQDLQILKQKYPCGEMHWGLGDGGEAILMLKLGNTYKWTPHTDEAWDELLSYANRSMSKNLPNASNGIGELQFLHSLGWKIVKKP